MSSSVAPPLAGSRATSVTVAPIFASASAVSLPMPLLAPVTRQTLPSMEVSVLMRYPLLYGSLAPLSGPC